MKYLKAFAIVVLALATAACWNRGFLDDRFLTSTERYAAHPVKPQSTETDGSATARPMEPGRKVSEQDCSRSSALDGGNLLCR